MLDGMFSFVLLDTRDKSFIAARDAIGITPLYVGWGLDGMLLFPLSCYMLLKNFGNVSKMFITNFYVLNGKFVSFTMCSLHCRINMVCFRNESFKRWLWAICVFPSRAYLFEQTRFAYFFCSELLVSVLPHFSLFFLVFTLKCLFSLFHLLWRAIPLVPILYCCKRSRWFQLSLNHSSDTSKLNEKLRKINHVILKYLKENKVRIWNLMYLMLLYFILKFVMLLERSWSLFITFMM